MPATSEPVSTLTLIMSSAVISAAVNVGWSALSKLFDRIKEEKKEAQKVGHVYLAIAFQLEAFARQCNGRLYDISEATDRYRQDHDSSAYDNLSDTSFVFDPEPDWSSLPVPFVAKTKALPDRFDQCNSWINEQFQHWADIDEAYEMEQERLAFYALRACDLAADIRTQIKAGDAELEDLVNHFQLILDIRRKAYRRDSGRYNFIPEVRAQFERESPPTT